MGSESIAAKNRLENEARISLAELKDWIILFDMAGEYLCDGPVLRRMAAAIRENLGVLKKRSEELKEQFVGKPLHDIDIDEPLDNLSAFSNRLAEANDRMGSRCREGKIAGELEDRLDFLKQRLNTLKDRVDGQMAPYGAGDSLTKMLARLKGLLLLLVSTYKKVAKFSLVISTMVLVVFISLFATMESEKNLRREIRSGHSLIRFAKAQLAATQEKLDEIQSRTGRMEGYVLTRKDRISLLELNLKSHRFEDQREKIQAELDQQKKTLAGNVKRLKELKRKSFLARLLRM